MDSYLQLDKVTGKTSTEVGNKALTLAKLGESARIPFSLVLTDEVFKRFIRENNLDTLVDKFRTKTQTSFKDKANLFSEIAELWNNTDFPASLREELEECFDLLRIDTSNLENLSSSEQSPVIAIQRSVSYHDTDTISDRLFFVSDHFEKFLEKIKMVMLSVFTPSSQTAREEQSADIFHLGVILSSVPNVNACFESTAHPSNNRMHIESYLGFYDHTRTIERDSFTLGMKFLKIKDTNIQSQSKVAVFDKESDTIRLQHHLTTSSSQSAPEQVILECGRLSKKLLAITNSRTHTIFVATENNNLYCISIRTARDKSEASLHESAAPSENKQQTTPSRHQQPQSESETSHITGTDALATALHTFLKRNSDPEHRASIKILLRSLEHESSPETLSQALMTAKSLLKNKWTTNT